MDGRGHGCIWTVSDDQPEGERNTRGHVLVSVPALPDDNFDRTVVYVIDHDEHGAIGVVLNRPSSLAVPEELRIGPSWASPPVMFEGGPVTPEAVIVLGRRKLGEALVGAAPVSGTITVLAADAVHERSVGGVELLRAFVGYAGWGPRQLDMEIEAGVWVVLDVLPDDVFSGTPEDLWRAVLTRQGGRLASIARHPLDPSVN